MHQCIKFILFWNDTLSIVKPSRCTNVSNASFPKKNNFDRCNRHIYLDKHVRKRKQQIIEQEMQFYPYSKMTHNQKRKLQRRMTCISTIANTIQNFQDRPVHVYLCSVVFKSVQTVLQLRYPRCVCNNKLRMMQVEHNQFISRVLMKQHVSAYSEAIIRFTMLAVRVK